MTADLLEVSISLDDKASPLLRRLLAEADRSDPPIEYGPYPTFDDPPESVSTYAHGYLHQAKHLMSRGLYGLASLQIWLGIHEVGRSDTDSSEEGDGWLYALYERMAPMTFLPGPSGGNAKDRRRSLRRAAWLWRLSEGSGHIPKSAIRLP